MSFDSYALNWDTEARIERAETIALEISREVDSRIGSEVMEFGCGTGLISFNLLDRFKDITLVDSSKGMIEILNQKIDKYKINDMKTYQMDILTRKMDQRFNAVYSSLVIHHIIDTKALMREFFDLLKDNGNLCIVDLNEEDGSFHSKYPDYEGHNGFKQGELKKILLDIGFKDVESRTFYTGEKRINGKSVEYSLFIMKARK